MISSVVILFAVSLLSHTEWESLRERLEELGEGDSKAVAAAMDILTREAHTMNIPVPKTGSSPSVTSKDEQIDTDIETLTGILTSELDLIHDDNTMVNLVNIEMELGLLDPSELDHLSQIVSSENRIDIDKLINSEEADEQPTRTALEEKIASKIDLTQAGNILANGLTLNLEDLDLTNLESITSDSLREIENTVKNLLMKNLDMKNVDIDSYIDDYADYSEYGDYPDTMDDYAYEDMTDEEIAAADAAAGIKAGGGELHFGPDTLRFEWTMGVEGWEELSDYEQGIWNSLDELTVEQIPEGRRMFEGHELMFFDPSQSEDSYRKRGRRRIQSAIASELSRQKRQSAEYPVISNYINATYRGTNRQGKYTSRLLNYTGQVNNDLLPDGIGVQESEGMLYKGGFNNGQRNGEGTARYKDAFGCTYAGTWLNDSMHGLGRLVCPCGAYFGHWQFGHPSPNNENTSITDSSSGCNITWWSQSDPVTFCNGKQLQKTRVSNETFEGDITPTIKFTPTTCPILTVQEPRPSGQCTFRTKTVTYKGDCNGSVATGKGTITSSLFGIELNVTVNNSIVSGEVDGVLHGMLFNGSIKRVHINNITDMVGEGVFTNGTITYTGHMKKGHPHGRIVAKVANHGVFYGQFVKGVPHGVIVHELSPGLRETAVYRYGVRHGLTHVYTSGTLSRITKYHFGSVVDTQEVSSSYFGVTWDFISSFATYGFFHIAGWLLIRRLLM